MAGSGSPFYAPQEKAYRKECLKKGTLNSPLQKRVSEQISPTCLSVLWNNLAIVFLSFFFPQAILELNKKITFFTLVAANFPPPPSCC